MFNVKLCCCQRTIDTGLFVEYKAIYFHTLTIPHVIETEQLGKLNTELGTFVPLDFKELKSTYLCVGL